MRQAHIFQPVAQKGAGTYWTPISRVFARKQSYFLRYSSSGRVYATGCFVQRCA
jgi:hypothetical protein